MNPATLIDDARPEVPGQGSPASGPSTATVVLEQVRTVGLAVRWEFLVLGAAAIALVVGAAVVAAVPALRVQVDGDLPLRLDPADLAYLAALLAAASPLAVWKDEAPWEDSQLWRLPVDRPRHALFKTGAGWVWLMAVVGIGLGGMIVGVVILGGTPGIEATRYLVVDPVAAAAGGVAGTTPVAWSTPWYEWVRPFTAATAVYLLATSLWVGTRRPWRWVAGGWIAMGILAGLVEFFDYAALASVARTGLGSLDQLFTGGADTLRRFSRDPSGEVVWQWRSLPTVARWAGHTALWIGIGVLAMVGAAFRHREG